MPETKPVALVTGASSGIGAAYARRFARDGYDLVLVARRAERLNQLGDELAARHGAKTEVLVADLGLPADVERVAARIAEGAPVEVLVNNAGFGVFRPLGEQSAATLNEMLQVNVGALLRLSHAAAPRLAALGRGAIINIASGTVFYPQAAMGVYSATKAFILNFTRALHDELAAKGVQVQALIPGLVETEFFDHTGDNRLATVDRSMVMQPDDLVEASLAGLRSGEVVCIPSLADYAAFERYQAAEREILMGVSRDRIAERYRA